MKYYTSSSSDEVCVIQFSLPIKLPKAIKLHKSSFSAKFWMFESMVSWLPSFRACDKQHCHRKAVLQQMLLISWQAKSKMGTEGLEPLYLFKVCLQFPNILPTRIYWLKFPESLCSVLVSDQATWTSGRPLPKLQHQALGKSCLLCMKDVVQLPCTRSLT